MSDIFKLFNEVLLRETKEATCCNVSLVSAKDLLSQQLEDELNASQRYENIGKVMANFEERTPGVLKGMAEDEFQHYLNLISIVTVMNEVCRCGGK